jgi:hypothetical protein
LAQLFHTLKSNHLASSTLALLEIENFSYKEILVEGSEEDNFLEEDFKKIFEKPEEGFSILFTPWAVICV